MTKILGTLVVVLVLAGIVYYFLTIKPPTAATPTPTTQVTSQTKEFTLKVAGGELVDGSNVLRVKQGDTVVIHITADVEEELHVHGYDKSVDLKPNTEATLTFVADQSGRFEYELEDSKTDIGALEVEPK